MSFKLNKVDLGLKCITIEVIFGLGLKQLGDTKKFFITFNLELAKIDILP